jgi:transcriptional regulator with XRE-family HTH domain
MAARPIPLERPPSKTDEAKVLREQSVARERIGALLLKLRTEAGLSLRQVGLRADVSANYLSEAERGKRSVTIDFLVRMAYHLGTTPSAFLFPEDCYFNSIANKTPLDSEAKRAIRLDIQWCRCYPVVFSYRQRGGADARCEQQAHCPPDPRGGDPQGANGRAAGADFVRRARAFGRRRGSPARRGDATNYQQLRKYWDNSRKVMGPNIP